MKLPRAATGVHRRATRAMEPPRHGTKDDPQKSPWTTQKVMVPGRA